MTRRKAQNPMAPSVAGHGRRLSARHMRSSSDLPSPAEAGFAKARAIAHVHLRRFATAGPAFAIGAPQAILAPFPAPLHSALGKRLGRSDRRRLAWALRSSASSWQGFLVSPGEPRPPPECLAANQARGAPHPVPPQRTPRDGAPQWTRCAELMGGSGGGDKFSGISPVGLLY